MQRRHNHGRRHRHQHFHEEEEENEPVSKIINKVIMYSSSKKTLALHWQTSETLC